MINSNESLTQSQADQSHISTDRENKEYAKIEKGLLYNAFPNQDDDRQHSIVHTEDLSAYNSTSQEQSDSLLRRSWVKRTFGPIGPGSLRSSVISLMSISIGSGMLAIPCKTYFFLLKANPVESGLLISLIVMVICAATARYTMSMLMNVAFQKQISSYSMLVDTTVGRTARILYDVDVFFYGWGTAICYQIIFASFFWQGFAYFGMDETLEKEVKMFIGLGFCVLNFPISMLKNVYQLRYFSQFQISVIFCLNIAVVIYFFWHIDPDKMKNDIKWIDFNMYFFVTYANTLFLYVAHQIIFPLRVELKRPNIKRMNKIFNRALFAEFVIYTSFMLFGFLTWFSKTQPIIFDNYINIYFTIAKLLMATGLFFTNSMNLILSRNTFLQLIGKEDNKITYTLTVGVLQVVSAAVAIFYPQAKSAFGFMGGFLGLNFVVVFPGLIYFKTIDKPYYTLKNVCIFLFVIISSIVGYIGAVMSLML